MTITIPLVAIMGALAFACYWWGSLKLGHMLVCLLAGFLIAATAYAPAIDHFLLMLFGGHK